MKPQILLLMLLLLLTLSFVNYPRQAMPAPTTNLYSEKTPTQLKQIQQTALNSDYAYKQTAFLSYDNGE